MTERTYGCLVYILDLEHGAHTVKGVFFVKALTAEEAKNLAFENSLKDGDCE